MTIDARDAPLDLTASSIPVSLIAKTVSGTDPFQLYHSDSPLVAFDIRIMVTKGSVFWYLSFLHHDIYALSSWTLRILRSRSLEPLYLSDYSLIDHSLPTVLDEESMEAIYVPFVPPHPAHLRHSLSRRLIGWSSRPIGCTASHSVP